MKKLVYILPLLTSSFFISCGSAETEKIEKTEDNNSPKGTQDEPATNMVYNLDPSTAVVKWTGFKTPEKIGVDGEFTSYSISGYHENASNIAEMMTGTEILIDVASTKTGDESRDAKIIEFFFGTMVNTANIEATIISLQGEENGTAQIEIKMNEVSFTQEMEWIFRSDLSTFILQGIINVPDFGAEAALSKLTEVCFEKHQGVTWSDVEVKANVKVSISPQEGI